jgi:hypothetical protein
MIPADIAEALLQLTGSLSPVGPATTSDLEQARTALAQTLMHGVTASQLISKPLAEAVKPPTIHAAVFDDATHSQIQSLARAVVAAYKPAAAPTQLAYLHSLSSASAAVPVWAAGMQVTKTLGPFEDSSGVPYWLHIFTITESLRFAYGSAANIFGVFPVKMSIVVSPGTHKHFDLGQGSIWFRAPWFATAAPSDSFTGFQIRSGSIDFSVAASIVSGVVVIPSGATFKMSAKLSPNPAPVVVNGPGADANHQVVQTPANVQINFAENSAKLVSLDDSSLTTYGTTVNLHWNNVAPAFAAGQIAISCNHDVAAFSFSNVRSKLFVPSGVAAIATAGWALPAPETPVTNLGHADGAGYLYLGLSSGVSAQWKTHGTAVALDDVILEAAPGSLSIIAASSTAKPLSYLTELWEETPVTLNRKSTVEFVYAKPASIVYLASASAELLYSTGTVNAYLDRPVEANGSRVPLTKMSAVILLFAETTQTRVFLLATPNAKPSVYSKALSIAFKNALLGVQPPSLLILTGKLQAETDTLQQCRVSLFFNAYWLLPTLPDPYAASFDTVQTVRSQESANSSEILLIQIQWSGVTNQPVIHLALAIPSQTNSGLGFLANVGSVRQVGEYVLLDLSSRADLFGVKIARDFDQSDSQSLLNVQNNVPIYGFMDLSLAFNQGFLATFALPQTSWEPMLSEETPNGIITAGLDAADGGPLVVHSVNLQQLVPVAPIPVLTSQITNVAAGKSFHADFSLPFGLTSRIEQPNQLVKTKSGSRPQFFVDLGAFELTRPDFDDHNLRGGHQLTLISPSNTAPPTADQPDASFDGFTHVFPFPADIVSGLPTGYGYTVLSQDVGQIFEGEFGNSGTPMKNGVPLRRIDFSGYGASIFSEWKDDKHNPPDILKVQFSTITGRTGYEVVKAATILYPYCVRIVRTVTIQRKLAGWVDRKDSGWQAATPGEFKFLTPDFAGHVHNGAVLGVYNVRNIRELDDVIDNIAGIVGPNPPPPDPPDPSPPIPFSFRKVLFDAEIGVDSRLHVVSGGTVSTVPGATTNPITLVPSRDIVGYVQLAPTFDPGVPDKDYSAHPAQIRDLIAKAGPFTPDLPCVVEIAKLGALPGVGLRCTTVEVNMATEGTNSPAVAVAVRGAPQLPRDGAWGVGKRGSNEPAPRLLPPSSSVPLVQNAADISAWHFADTTDVLQLDNPDNLYSFLQSTGTQKVLFERPTVPQAGVASGGGGNAPGIQLPQPPSFGDMGALLNATGLFPDIANALSLNTGVVEQIENQAGGLKYKKVFTYPLDPSTPSGAKQLTLTNLAGVFELDLAYADITKGTTKPTVITLIIDPSASPRWSISITPLSLLVTIPSISTNPLLSIITGYNSDPNPSLYVDGFIGDENTKPHVTNLNVQFSGALDAIQAVFSRIEAIASFLPGGKAAGLKIGLSDGRLSVEDSFALPTLPLGLGELSGISLNLGVGIQLSPLNAAFTVGIGSPDNPFNWIVSPLSGNGLIDLGLKDNKPNIDLQAGIGLALAIDLGIASGSAAIVIALNVDVNPPAITLMVLLTGQASVDVLDGLASASLTLTAGIGVSIDPIPVPPALKIKVLPPEIDFPAETITMLATVSVGIHLSVCWVASVDWDGSWQFSQSFTTPEIDVSL